MIPPALPFSHPPSLYPSLLPSILSPVVPNRLAGCGKRHRWMWCGVVWCVLMGFTFPSLFVISCSYSLTLSLSALDYFIFFYLDYTCWWSGLIIASSFPRPSVFSNLACLPACLHNYLAASQLVCRGSPTMRRPYCYSETLDGRQTDRQPAKQLNIWIACMSATLFPLYSDLVTCHATSRFFFHTVSLS